MMVAPCKGCDDRHDLRHSDCETYLNYKKEHDAERLALYERNQIDCTLKGLHIHRNITRKKG